MDADFPLLHAHSLIGVWGALEAMVYDVIRAWLTHRPSLLKTEAFTGVKVPLAEFHRMKSSDRIEQLMEHVRPQGTGGGFQRLEAWLAKVDLDGPLDEKLRRLLIESWEVRNVYVHRGDLADKKARENCPWRRRDWKLGKPIRVSHSDYGRYTKAIHDYVFEIIVRSSAKFGIDARTYSETVSRLVRAGELEWSDDGRVVRKPKPSTRKAGNESKRGGPRKRREAPKRGSS